MAAPTYHNCFKLDRNLSLFLRHFQPSPNANLPKPPSLALKCG